MFPFLPQLLQVLEHVAAVLGKDSAEVKAANFLPEVTTTTTNSGCSSSSSSDDGICIPAAEDGVVRTVLGRLLAAEGYTLPRLWRELLASSGYAARVAAVREHNRQHAWSKRGIVVTPVRWEGVDTGCVGMGGGWSRHTQPTRGVPRRAKHRATGRLQSSERPSGWELPVPVIV
jgi:hypothetical protein